MKLKKIIKEVKAELKRAEKKYPDDKWPWKDDLTIFEMVGLVINEAGEALQAANKIYYNDSIAYEIDDVKKELIQVISTSIRVLKKL